MSNAVRQTLERELRISNTHIAAIKGLLRADLEKRNQLHADLQTECLKRAELERHLQEIGGGVTIRHDAPEID